MKTLNHNGLYLSIFTPDKCQGHILYVHGGPGFHSGYFEIALQELPSYSKSKIGWICYDQRGCGRSGEPTKDITHRTNIDDLNELINLTKRMEGINLLSVMGHSYGSWLSYQTLIEKNISIPLIAVARAKDIRTARNRSFAMDMLEARMRHPEVYSTLLEELSDFDQPLWAFQKRIKEKTGPLELRPFFMWGNLATKSWYESVKAKVDLKENWTLTKQISNSADASEHTIEVSPERLPSGLLWINGIHDFLMGSDQYYPGIKNQPVTFLKSGHYPHLEEPERFMKELKTFLKL